MKKLLLLLFLSPLLCSAQVGTPVKWVTGKTYTNLTVLIRENGNYLQVGIEGQDWNKVSAWFLKTAVMKIPVVHDTIKIVTVCPPPIDVKTTTEYKALLQKLADANQKITDSNAMLAQEITLVNSYQAENDKLNAERQVLIDENRRMKDLIKKFKPVTYWVPREDSL